MNVRIVHSKMKFLSSSIHLHIAWNVIISSSAAFEFTSYASREVLLVMSLRLCTFFSAISAVRVWFSCSSIVISNMVFMAQGSAHEQRWQHAGLHKTACNSHWREGVWSKLAKKHKLLTALLKTRGAMKNKLWILNRSVLPIDWSNGVHALWVT